MFTILLTIRMYFVSLHIFVKTSAASSVSHERHPARPGLEGETAPVKENNSPDGKWSLQLHITVKSQIYLYYPLGIIQDKGVSGGEIVLMTF